MLWSFWRRVLITTLNKGSYAKQPYILDFGPYIIYVCVNASRLALCTLWHESLAYSCLSSTCISCKCLFSPLVRSYPLWWWWCCILSVSCFSVTPQLEEITYIHLPPPCKASRTTGLKNPKTTKPNKNHETSQRFGGLYMFYSIPCQNNSLLWLSWPSWYRSCLLSKINK